MKVVVLGAGVMGVTVAHALWRHGHEVTVLERAAGVALETSLGNAGGLCPGFAGPWAAPGMPLKVLKMMFQKDAAVRFVPRLDPAQWSWAWAFLRNCTPERFARNKRAMQRIAHFSLDCLKDIRAEIPLDYDGGQKGVLQLLQGEAEMQAGQRAAAVLQSLGIAHRMHDRAGVLALEPALALSAAPIAGGLHLPGDETGDCHKFTVGLAAFLAAKGVEFRFDTEITGLEVEAGRFRSAMTTRGSIQGDACVVALGPWAPRLLKPLGIRVPIYPVKGYALTLPIDHAAAAPVSSIMDERSKTMLTRLGDRLRVAGMAEVAGYDRSVRPKSIAALRKVVTTLLPGMGDPDRGSVWAGLRPMTPDGPAYLGRSPVDGLYLNIGQGSNGWTQACGSARIVADILTGLPAPIDLDGMGYTGRA